MPWKSIPCSASSRVAFVFDLGVGGSSKVSDTAAEREREGGPEAGAAAAARALRKLFISWSIRSRRIVISRIEKSPITTSLVSSTAAGSAKVSPLWKGCGLKMILTTRGSVARSSGFGVWADSRAGRTGGGLSQSSNNT